MLLARCCRGLALAAGLILLVALAAPSAPAQELIVNGDFEALASGDDLRKDNKGQDWSETRRDGEGRDHLKLSTKDIHGNATRKAMLKAHPELNTYLTQRLAESQKGPVKARFDICVKEILADDNRSAFFFLGKSSDKKNGPNSTGRERFVFLGFENAVTPGKMNLFVREGDTTWEGKTIVAPDLDLKTWYTVILDVNTPEGIYAVTVEGVVEAFEVESFYTRGKTPSRLSHVSFATWNDGAGTFYVDNVSVQAD